MSAPQYLKRLIAAIGLLLMLPLGYGLLTGMLTPTDAATRAGALFLAVMVARKIADLAPSGREVLVPVADDEQVEESVES